MNNDVVDLFQEELDKKQLKEEKKIAKKIAKEKKRNQKKEKKLEKQEDEEFAKTLEKKNTEDEIVIEKENVLDEIIKEKTTRLEKNNVEIVKKHTFLNILLTISIIALLVISCDYAIYNIIKQKDMEIIITSSALCLLSIFYILSIIIKKTGFKKVFQILATLSIVAYMAYQLFII